MIKICVAGSRGRMGARIMELARSASDLEVVSAFDIDGNAEESMRPAQVVIDFTAPKATAEYVGIARRLRKPVVIGTTGLAPDETAAITDASRVIPIVFSPNMSVGVNLLFKLVSDAARVLGKNYAVDMTEAHHIHKKDKPSGTAKRLAELVAKARGIEVSVIPIESIREGEIVGDHTVTFKSDNETVKLFHSAASRDAFASGALEAARFVAGKKKGLYSMADVLGIN